MIGVPGDPSPVVKKVEPGKPAAAIGLRAGDQVIAVDGRPTANFDAVARAIQNSKGRALTVRVLRGDAAISLGPARAVSTGGRYILGFYPRTVNKEYAFGAALRRSLTDNWKATRATVTFLPHLFQKAGRKDVSGPVGIVDVSRQAAGIDFALFLQIMGLISLSLALLNLLPLLPLDGGHILFSIIEGLRGRPVAREVYERVSAVGIALFLILMFIGLSNDIGRLGGG
jgi:regulator of sigma E protease